jgi:hypothetical protein
MLSKQTRDPADWESLPLRTRFPAPGPAASTQTERPSLVPLRPPHLPLQERMPHELEPDPSADERPRRSRTRLETTTLRKLDFILLPFLALLFLFNSVDKANIGNAESAHFTTDVGLRKEDLNTAVALFFVFFVALQPLGAALGRRYGMVRWVPSCMALWGLSTLLHVWVRSRWQLYVLRSIIGCLEGVSALH